MSERTIRHGLPFIVPGQAQKEVWHNEALALLDVALHAAVETAPTPTPPAAPAPGQCWLVGAAATGAWAGRDFRVAAWSASGWRFVAPTPGMTAWNKAAGHWLYWTGTEWSDGAVPAARLVVDGVQVVGRRRGGIASPSGGSIIDGEARAAITTIIETLMSHGLID